jgi:hypothetical protein
VDHVAERQQCWRSFKLLWKTKILEFFAYQKLLL